MFFSYFVLFHSDYHHYEVSLKAIIAARDKWLKPDGIMFPDCCHIHLAGINDGDLHRSMYYWNNVYDFDMHAIRRDRMAEPFLFNVEKKTVRQTDKIHSSIRLLCL